MSDEHSVQLHSKAVTAAGGFVRHPLHPSADLM
jgi:hypothetical protein